MGCLTVSLYHCMLHACIKLLGFFFSVDSNVSSMKMLVEACWVFVIIISQITHVLLYFPPFP